jgi:hypothetical protein
MVLHDRKFKYLPVHPELANCDTVLQLEKYKRDVRILVAALVALSLLVNSRSGKIERTIRKQVC